MSISPFIYGTTVSSNGFTNRESEVDKLYKNLTQGINTMLISPRRWGKSSLVERVVLELKEQSHKYKTVNIDLFSVANEEEFLELFAREVIKASSTNWQEWIETGKTFFKQLMPKMNIGINPSIDFEITFNWKELKKHKDEVLNLPEVIAKDRNIRFIICLDEFQNLAICEDFQTLEKQMRAIWQRQKSVSYCLYGSKRHMMNEIFNNSSKPFYRFGDVMLLQKIKREKWVNFITQGFMETGKSISNENAGLIALSMKDHSWYVQQLAHYTWQLTDKVADNSILNQALTELIYANTPFYQKEAESLSITQLNLLKAISQGEKVLSGVEVMHNYKLGTSANVTKNKVILINFDIIHEQEGQFEFLDPAFELWFKKVYFRQSYGLE